MSKKGVSGVRAALEIAERQLPRSEFSDPEPGAPKKVDGVEVRPGEWQPDRWGLPPQCPVEPLGMLDDVLYLVDVMGQLRAVAPSALGQKFVQSLFGDRQHYLYWAWPRHSKKGLVEGWRAEMVAEAFYQCAAAKGMFDPADRVRGRGAWLADSGALIVHSGDALWASDRKAKRGHAYQQIPTGTHGGILYPRRPVVAAPWPEPVPPAENPAAEIVQSLRRWNWERPQADPILLLGWLAGALVGGALPWRPVAFLVGDKSVGKSSLQTFAKSVIGDGLLKCADTTAAGIYQRVKQDSLPVAVDELEAEADNRKVMSVIKLARLAASGDMMFRGGQDHVGVEFRCRSSFLFSAINAPPLQPQDVSRICMLRLHRLDPGLSAQHAPTIDGDTTAPMLLRRMMDEWHRFDAAFEAYRDVLRDAGHDGRGQDTYGVLLACADLALGPECADTLGVPMVDDLRPWGEWLATGKMLEHEDAGENWVACLNHLMTSKVEAWRGGVRHTVGQLLDDLETDSKDHRPQGMTVSEANTQLAQAGLKVLVPGDCGPGWTLAVPNESQLVMTLFRDTQWAGLAGASVWKSALRQGPREVVVVDPAVNRHRINGRPTRCTLVRLDAFAAGGW